MAKKPYTISENDLVKLLADIDLVVVSLDRIGSSSENLEKARSQTAAFFGNPSMFRRLARMRRVLSEVFDKSASPKAAKRLEATLQRVKYWRNDAAN